MNAPRASEDVLLALRDEFPTLRDSVHMVSHSLGAMPRAARDHTQAYLERWQHDSIEAWQSWMPFIESVEQRVARVLGVEHGSVVMTQNCTTAQHVVASCFDWHDGKRNKIVYSALEFSTVHYAWSAQEKRGARVVVVPSRDGIENPLDDFLSAIDEETRIVVVSHVLFRSSALQDLEAIVACAHSVGAYVLVDTYQSAGIVPLELGRIGVDFACGGSIKWICGGPGTGYLYVRPELLASLEPVDTGWFAHERPFAFDMGPMKYAPNAWRMLGGTVAVPALAASFAGWDLIASLDMHAVRAKSLRQTSRLRALLIEQGATIRTPHDDARRGGTMCVDFDGSEAVASELNRRRFFCDWRPACGIRVSPHFYTTDDEVERFAAEVTRIRAGS